MRQGYLRGVWLLSPSAYPSPPFAFFALTNVMHLCVCVCSCVSVYMYVWELTHVRRYRARICPCVTAARGEERGPQQQTTTQTVAGLSEVILSNGEQTTGHYHTDAASVQM